MTTQLAPSPIFQAFNTNGQFLVGGLLYTYLAGTTTPVASYVDSTQTTQNTNPIVLNTTGSASIWLVPGQAYKFNLTDSAGNQIPNYPVDNINGPALTSATSISYLAPGSSITTTVAAELARQFLTPEDYGAVGDGLTDDTVALTNWINALNTGPNSCGKMAAKTYCITAPLPAVTTSGVSIIGCGPDETHNGGSFPLGSVIKWNGGVSTSTMFTAGALNGAPQFMVGFRLIGVSFDCNAGTAGGGVLITSMRGGDIDVFVKEANVAGITFQPVAGLSSSDPTDIQFNTIKFKGYQNAANGIAMVLNGTNTANTSLNVFTCVDIFHVNQVAINSINTDSNIWVQVRLFHAGSGSAVYSWTFQGSNTIAVNVRSEQIFRLSSTLPVKANGTGLAYPAGYNQPIKIYNLDKGNGSPDPVMDLTSPPQIVWQNDTTPLYPLIWTIYTPTITGGGSGFVAGTVTAQYLQEPHKTTVVFNIAVTTAGTGTSSLSASLPSGIPAAAGAYLMTGAGWDQVAGAALVGVINAGSTTVSIYKSSTAGYPAVSGSVLTMTIIYETL